MDHLKLLVKDVFHKMQDTPEISSFSPIRMSEIASKSSLSSYTSRSVSEQSVSNTVDRVNMDTQNNNDTTNLKPINNKETVFQTDQKNKTNYCEVDGINRVQEIVNDLEKLQIHDKGSHDSVFSLPNRSPLLPKAGKTNKPKIFMGKRALLRAKSSDLQENPSVVVHELVNVNDKYHDKISHYIGRMYQRRLSRESKNTDDDGTSSNYSAGSLSTIGTPDSLYDGKSYFSLLYPPRSECEFDFLKSTDDVNKDTTAETFMSSTMNSVNTQDVSTDLDYDPQKFLKNALGEVSLGSQSLDVSFPNSRLHSQSMDTVNASSLLSKAGSLYSSVRRSIKRACSFKDRNLDEASKNRYRGKDRCQSFSPDSFGPAENLMQELYVQNGIIFQVSKALTYCRNTKDVRSREYIEAEKILLVASCHKEALQTALDAAEFGEKEKCCQKYSGTLEITNVIYYLKGDVFTEAEPQNNFTEYFVVVVTSGKTVLASKVLTADKNGEVKPDKTFSLTGLATEFEIAVAIYSMKIIHLEKNHGYSLKSHKKERKVPCPSPKSFFHLHHRSSHRNLQVENVLSIKPSSFTLWGTCVIRCSDMERTHFRMHHVPLCSSLEGYFTAVLSSHVTLTNRANGFLTIGIEDKAHLVWNRRWCVLEGPFLKYWNYPSEEFSSEPIGSIDLRCATEKVSPADRSICPRAKSLCLLIKNNDLILKYFLSADSPEEKQSWQEELNFVIGTLGAWNCLNIKTTT